MLPAMMFHDAAARQRANALSEFTPRGRDNAYEEAAASKARTRVYKFGEHLKAGHAGNGVLATVPTSADTDMDLVKGMLLRAAYGDSVDFELLDFTHVFLYLMPDGEELTNAGASPAPRSPAAARAHHHPIPLQT
jgi:hypothetical protein